MKVNRTVVTRVTTAVDALSANLDTALRAVSGHSCSEAGELRHLS
jgi:hypothetical protein